MPKRLLIPIRGWWHRMDQSERRNFINTLLIVAPFVGLAIVVISLVTATYTEPLRIAPPLAYSEPEYKPEGPAGKDTSSVCPGDTITWRINLRVSRAPVMVISVRTIWDVDNNQTAVIASGGAVPDGSFSLVNWIDQTVIERDVPFVVPDLMPGRYEIRNAVQEFNSQAAMYRVRFAVRGDCDDR